MENSPGILFWILAVVSVVAAVVIVNGKRGIVVFAAIVVLTLAIMNLLILLGIIGLAFVYAIISILALAAIVFALYKSGELNMTFEIVSHPKPVFILIISILIYIACLFLISQTDVWQYAAEESSFTFLQILETLSQNYLLPFILFKSFLMVILVILFVNARRSNA